MAQPIVAQRHFKSESDAIAFMAKLPQNCRVGKQWESDAKSWLVTVRANGYDQYVDLKNIVDAIK